MICLTPNDPSSGEEKEEEGKEESHPSTHGSMKKAIFIGFNALGDTLCTTPVLRAFRKRNPGISVLYIVQNATFCRVLDANPDIDLVLYSEQMYLSGSAILNAQWLQSLPLDIQETTHLYHFDIQQVCAKPESFHEHISRGFSKLLNIPIDSIRPVVLLTPQEERLAGTFIRKPYFIFSMHSVSNPMRPDGNGLAKEWPRERWLRLAEMIHAYGDFDVIAIGSERDPPIASPYLRNLYGLPIKITAALLQRARCVIALENGIAHLCAAVDAPLVEIYSNIVPLAWAHPKESSYCEVLFGNPQSISCDEVIDAIQLIFSKKGLKREVKI
jgi:ADP-heptose:LPS heptosyltransferase